MRRGRDCRRITTTLKSENEKEKKINFRDNFDNIDKKKIDNTSKLLHEKNIHKKIKKMDNKTSKEEHIKIRGRVQ